MDSDDADIVNLHGSLPPAALGTQEIISHAEEVLRRLALHSISEEEVRASAPPQYGKPFNTALHLECARAQVMLKLVRSSLHELIEMLLGRRPMSPEAEAFAIKIAMGALPDEWLREYGPSKRPLASFAGHLSAQCSMLERWRENGDKLPPAVMPLDLLFVPNAFLSTVHAHAARSKSCAFDTHSGSGQLQAPPTRKKGD